MKKSNFIFPLCNDNVYALFALNVRSFRGLTYITIKVDAKTNFREISEFQLI